MDAITGLSTSTAQPASPDGRRSALTSDFDTFLQMLTAQARNQDPLDPLDASDYASQLATFSSVEQQVLTNDLLTEISAAVAGSTLDRLRGWVGAEVLASVPAVFDGTPVTVRADVPESATRAEVVARNADGAVVSRIGIDAVSGLKTWNGSDEQGKPLPAGSYALTVDSFADDEPLGSRPAEVYARVTEARWDTQGEAVLTLSDGTELREEDVTGLRVSG